ncbi:hypothetical protein AAIJ07_31810, partial [Pseudomonas aeruginosa]
PALCGFAGGVLGGVFSDYLIKRGLSLTLARKLPIVLGMLLASTIILCNYTNNTTLVVMLMALAFFGKGFGALGWPVISDTAPKEIVGLCGGRVRAGADHPHHRRQRSGHQAAVGQ